MADRQSRVVAALNFLTGEGIAYHLDGCDQSAIDALINDYFTAPSANEESNSSDSEGMTVLQIKFGNINLWLIDEKVTSSTSTSTHVNGCPMDTGNAFNIIVE